MAQIDRAPEFSLILIGDAGKKTSYSQTVLDRAYASLDTLRGRSSIIFLGDNIYPVGLPPKEDPERSEMESRLEPQLFLIKEFGTGFIVPGNHDWAKGRSNGRTNLKEQEEFTIQYAGVDAFYPKDGCPGPVEKELTSNLTLIIIDTQWLLVESDKNSEYVSCAINSKEEVFGQLRRILKKNEDKTILFAAHHPILTYGSHGGVYSIKNHLFPLTDMKKYLWIPLPVVGSLYPGYRKWIGNIQDATNRTYQNIMENMVELFEDHGRVIHTAGHEHALEHMTRSSIEYIVSGSGAKNEYVRKKGYAKYVTGDTGFAQLHFYETGKIYLEFWAFDKENFVGSRVYSSWLFE